MVRLLPTAAKGTALRATRGELAGGGIRVGLAAKALTISDGGAPTLRLWAPLESLAGISATVGAGGKLVVLLRDQGRCRTSVAVLRAASGKARDLRVIELGR